MAYGIELRNASGNVIVEMTGRYPRFVSSGTIPDMAALSTTYVTISGMANNDTWEVYVSGGTQLVHKVTVTKETNRFGVYNTHNATLTGWQYWVLRL